MEVEGPPVRPKTAIRSFLSSLWSLVTLLTIVAFLVATVFTLSSEPDDTYYYYNNDRNEPEQDRQRDLQVAVTTRAMAFAALWALVLALLIIIFGTVILGWSDPCSGRYYTCCSPQVHRTTPLSLGAFIGALLMFANMTLVCAALFGEFQILDYTHDGEDRDHEAAREIAVSRSSTAFSILCGFLTALHGGFCVLMVYHGGDLLAEADLDVVPQRRPTEEFAYQGYQMGERFDVQRRKTGFVPPPRTNGRLA